MKKTFLYLLLVLVGIGIGYLLNNNSEGEGADQNDPKKIYFSKNKKQKTIDTVKIKEHVKTPAPADSVFITDTVYLSDTLASYLDEADNSNYDESDEIIIMEELISQRTIPLEPSPNDSTDVSEMLNLKSSAFSKDIIVEFWQSPLNITGYELTRNKLKLFGFNPNESISLQLDKNEEQILLNTESMSIVLQKSKQFKTLKLR